MAAVSCLFDRIPDFLEGMVCAGRIIFEKGNASGCKNQSYREYRDWFYLGKICMAQNANAISFNKGYTENGFAEKVFHLHLRHIGDNNELYFRDYLIEHPDVAGEYEKMKLKLWKEYEHNRDGYTDAKTEFIQKYTEKARVLYKNRY